MFKKRQSSAVGIEGSTNVAVRPGYELLPGAVAGAKLHNGGLSAKQACSECVWAHGDYGQPGGLVVGLTSGYGVWAGRAATHACLALQQALPTGKQWLKLGKGKQLRALKQAFGSVSTPAAISAERGRSGALGVVLFVCRQSGALFLASTGGRLAAARSRPPVRRSAGCYAAGEGCRKCPALTYHPRRQRAHRARRRQPPASAAH
jgi:hypothetical protein